MNERINLLKFFLDSGNFSDESLTGQITEFFPAITFVYHLDSERITFCNRKFTSYFGLNPHLKEQDNILQALVHEEDWPKANNQLKRFIQLNEDETYSFCCRLRTEQTDGEFYKIFVSVLKRGITGKASTLLFICQDISKDIKLNEEAQSTKKLFEESEELLHFGTWTLFVDQGIMEWTKGLSMLLDYEKAHVVKPRNIYFSHVSGDHRKKLEDAIQECILHKTDFEAEYPVYTQTGSQKILFTKGKPILNSRGEVDRVLGITRDVTELRNFEKEQERSIRELNRSNRELEEFAYVASHDLQEPLRKISMFSERLKLKLEGTLDEESELFLNRIMTSSNNMRGLIDHLLEFSKTNRSSHHFVNVDIHGVVDQVLADLELKIEETRSVIGIQGTLPQIDGVVSDLKQLFCNLLSNAIKFRKKDSAAEIKILSRKLSKEEKKSLQLRVDRVYYRIDVSDKGIGFDQEYAEKIFLIFQRLNGKSEYPGSGIGLAICKKIIDNHNGIIFAHSEPDNGATFSVILPEKQL